MSEANKQLCRRFIEEVWNQQKLDLINELFAPDYVRHDPSAPDLGNGPAGERRLIEYYLAAFPDTRFTIHDLIAEDDRVAIRWSVQGTHRGELEGILPTGRRVSVTGTTTCRIAGGKIVEAHDNWDALGMMQQLGAIPARSGRAGA
jgi:steroid delta-isomerase-like uncharacterized protein